MDNGDDYEDDTDEEPLPADEWVSALVLVPRAPFIAWARRTVPDELDPPETAIVLTPELFTAEHRARWLEQHHERVFAEQLRPWTEDETAWPQDRSQATLSEWFDLTWVPVCDDLSYLPLGPPVACGPVSLSALRDEFASLADGSQLFLDVQSGEMVSFSPAELDALDRNDPGAADITADALAEMRRLYDMESLVPLPSPSESTTMALMQAFAEGVQAPAIRNRLLNALDSKKPIRRFLDGIEASGMRKQWAVYSQQMVLEAMRETLDQYGVPYIGAADNDESGPPGKRSIPSSNR
jgi:hypothetical protein